MTDEELKRVVMSQAQTIERQDQELAKLRALVESAYVLIRPCYGSGTEWPPNAWHRDYAALQGKPHG